MSFSLDFLFPSLTLILYTILAGCVLLVTVIICSLRWTLRRKAPSKSSPREIAFFHPFCSAGGGGERVLWKIVEALGHLNDQGLALKVIIYTVDTPQENYRQDLLQQVRTRFSIVPPLSLSIDFVHLHEYSRFLKRSNRFSLVAESWGTIMLAYKALSTRMPHIFIDTTGCAFTYFVARVLGGCKVGAYVHYPTISTDMLALVWSRRPTYNNDSQVTKSLLITYAKTLYYVLFAVAYGFVGSLAVLVMVNSTWTFYHIVSIWRGASKRIKIVFPPCDVTNLQNLPLEGRNLIVISIGQFRPEKDHALQIRSLALLREKYPKWNLVKLVLVGSCRGNEDETRVEELRKLVLALGLVESVDFVLNQPYSVVKDWFGKASVGIHTMWNEHFGIGVVEMMAAGLLVVAHNSGGPKADIVTPLHGNKQTGYLAATDEEYADAMNAAFSLDNAAAIEMRRNARISACRFSDEVFNETFKSVFLESGIMK